MLFVKYASDIAQKNLADFFDMWGFMTPVDETIEQYGSNRYKMCIRDSGNTPLVLVDGIERDLDLVDVEDIASFSILKDASASAVYGVRGANEMCIRDRHKPGKIRTDVPWQSFPNRYIPY